VSIGTYLTYLIRRKYPVHVCCLCFHYSKLYVLIINPDLVYDYYIPRYELVGWEISGAQLEPTSSNTEPPSVIEEDSTAFEPSASSSSQGIQQQHSLTNNDTQVSSTLGRTPAASSLIASPEAHYIDGEQSDSRIVSLSHQIASSPQMGSSTSANLGEMEPMPEMYSSTTPIVSGPYSTSNSEDWRSYFSDIFDVEHQPTGSSHTSWDCHRPDPQFTVPNRLSISWNSLLSSADRNLQLQRRVDTRERAVGALPAEWPYPDFPEDLEVLSSSRPPDETTHGHQDISLPVVTSDKGTINPIQESPYLQSEASQGQLYQRLRGHPPIHNPAINLALNSATTPCPNILSDPPRAYIPPHLAGPPCPPVPYTTAQLHPLLPPSLPPSLPLYAPPPPNSPAAPPYTRNPDPRHSTPAPASAPTAAGLVSAPSSALSCRE